MPFVCYSNFEKVKTKSVFLNTPADPGLVGVSFPPSFAQLSRLIVLQCCIQLVSMCSCSAIKHFHTAHVWQLLENTSVTATNGQAKNNEKGGSKISLLTDFPEHELLLVQTFKNCM